MGAVVRGLGDEKSWRVLYSAFAPYREPLLLGREPGARGGSVVIRA